MTITEADEIWWAEHVKQERQAFVNKHSELDVGQVVNAFLGRYKKLKTSVIIIATRLTCDMGSLWSHPLYFVQRLKGDPHIESIKREDID